MRRGVIEVCDQRDELVDKRSWRAPLLEGMILLQSRGSVKRMTFHTDHQDLIRGTSSKAKIAQRGGGFLYQHSTISLPGPHGGTLDSGRPSKWDPNSPGRMKSKDDTRSKSRDLPLANPRPSLHLYTCSDARG